MKIAAKFLSALFLCLSIFSFQSFAEEHSSKGFSVIWSLVDALHSLDWGSSYELSDTDEVTEMLTKLMNQNDKYELASRNMEEYLGDGDEFVSTIAKGLYAGSLSLVEANNKIIDKLRKFSNMEPEGFKDIEYTIAETNTQKKKSWEMILISAGWSLPVIMEYPSKIENPTGKIPFKISEKERKELVRRINELFGEKLTKYKEFLSLSKQGKETNPNDSTYIIAGVEKIREYLITETYEEAKANESKE